RQGTLIPVHDAIINPDTVRKVYAPNFVGWDSTSSDTTEIQLSNLTPDQDYVFVVVAFDEAGAYSPIFNLSSNMLWFKVGFAGVRAPKITFFNEFFNYTYTNGQFCPCPEIEVFLEVPAGQAITMNWDAEPAPGATIQSFRWALDIDDV